MSNHRKPPLPESMRVRPTKGTCRWCSKPVVDAKGVPTKGTWHPDCVTEFKLIHWPGETRRAVFQRDKGICARCGHDSDRQWQRWNRATLAVSGYSRAARDIEKYRQKLKAAGKKRIVAMGKGWKSGAWQHDHIRPLVEANGDLSFWHLDNIQTLCSACHVVKGREDNARRKAEKPSSQLELIAL